MLKLPDSFAGATSDSRLVRPGMLFVALKGEKVDGRDFIPQALEKGAAGVVEGLEELQRLASEYRSSLKAKVVGVTGSAGKTTTKEFLRAFLSRAGKTHATGGNFNNHIGLPLTILNTPEDADFLVLEMGTNHPGEIAALCDIARPDAGVISSIGTAHIEFFGSSEGIAREKGVLFERVREFCAVPENVKCKEILRGMAAGRFLEAPCESFLADALSVAFVFVWVKLVHVPVFVSFASLMGYCAYLTGRWFLDRPQSMAWGAAALALVILTLLVTLVTVMYGEPGLKRTR